MLPLLSLPKSNPKVAKNATLGVLTAPLHLAPYNLSGYQVCPMATAGCAAACLHTAGNPVHMAGKARARLRRTKLYFEDRPAFMSQLVGEVAKHVRRAKRENMAPAIRLNATSDIPWERVPVVVDGKKFPSIMSAFPRVKFYDYTKRPNRKNLPKNYSLTFSLSENNDDAALLAHKNGMNVAVVFNVVRGRPLPRAFVLAGVRVPVIDGDVHDYRPADRKRCVVGLRAKGAGRKDSSGFVRAVTQY